MSVFLFMPKRWTTPLVIASIALGLLTHDVLAAGGFATPAFQQRWTQDEGQIRNFWGPLALATNGQSEAYLSENSCPVTAPGMLPCPATPDALHRTVQYFDKGRMEANPMPGAPQVTSGLLVREMISGSMQTGDSTLRSGNPPLLPSRATPIIRSRNTRTSRPRACQ